MSGRLGKEEKLQEAEFPIPENSEPCTSSFRRITIFTILTKELSYNSPACI